MYLNKTGNQNGDAHWSTKYPDGSDWYVVINSNDGDSSYQRTMACAHCPDLPSYEQALVHQSDMGLPSDQQINIEKITVYTYVRNENASYRGYAGPLIKVGGSIYSSTVFLSGTSYSVQSKTWYYNPKTGQPWTKEDLEASNFQFGCYGKGGYSSNALSPRGPKGIRDYHMAKMAGMPPVTYTYYPVRCTYVYIRIDYWYAGKLIIKDDSTITIPVLPQRNVVVCEKTGTNRCVRYCVFYVRDGSIRYRTSIDGVNWGTEYAVVAISSNGLSDWNVYSVGRYILLVYPTGTYDSGSATASTLYAKYGYVPDSASTDGQINWYVSYQVYQACGYWDIGICKKDTYWYIVVHAYKPSGVAGYRVAVKRSSSPDSGGWAEILAPTYTGVDSNIRTVVDITEYESGVMLIFCRYYESVMYSRGYNTGTSTWDGSVTSFGSKHANQRFNVFSSAFVNNYTYVAVTSDIAGGTITVYYYWSGAWNTGFTASSGCKYPSIMSINCYGEMNYYITYFKTANKRMYSTRSLADSSDDGFEKMLGFFSGEVSTLNMNKRELSFSDTLGGGLISWRPDGDNTKLYACPLPVDVQVATNAERISANGYHIFPAKIGTKIIYYLVYWDNDDDRIYVRSSWDKINWGIPTVFSHAACNYTGWSAHIIKYSSVIRLMICYSIGTQDCGSTTALTVYTREAVINNITGALTMQTQITVRQGGCGFTSRIYCGRTQNYWYLGVEIYKTTDGTSYYIYIYKKTYSASSWTSVLTHSQSGGYQSIFTLSSDPNSTYGIVYVYGRYADSSYYYRVYNGSTWTDAATFATKTSSWTGKITSTYNFADGKVYCIYRKTNSKYGYMKTYITSWGNEEQVLFTPHENFTIEVVGNKIYVLAAREMGVWD